MNIVTKTVCLLCILSTVYASNDIHGQNTIQYQAQIGKTGDTSPTVTKLSDVLKSFKAKFDTDILFEDKAVEGLTVQGDVINTRESVEVNLTNLLNSFSLSFRKMKDKTYVVTTKRNKKDGQSASNNKLTENFFLPTEASTEANNSKLKSDSFNIAFSKMKAKGEIVITGNVKDDKNVALAGVTVRERGKVNVVATKEDGSFYIKVASTKAVIVFTYQGFEPKEVVVGSNTNFSIALKPTVKSLDEVVVIGYGTQKKKDLTGSVARVSVTDLQKAPVRSFEEALGGRVAGVQVTSTDGQPGSPVSIIIRGNNSLTQDNSPLYVVDGFPIENPNSNSINPADIESIDILKDASATAIYGARAANGVIMITTKKGATGKTKFTLNNYYGIQQIINKIDVLKPYDFVKYQSELDSVNTKGQYFSQGQTLDSFKNKQGIDWQDQVFRNAPISSTAFSMSGGNKDTKFFISGSALQQDGIVKYSGYNRYQGRFRFDHNINDKTVLVMNINYSALKGYGTIPSTLDNSSSQSSNLMYSVWGYRPIATNSVNLLSGIDPFFLQDPNDARYNPLETVEYQLRNRFSNTLFGNMSVTHEIIKDLKLKVVVGYTNDVDRNETFNGTNTFSGSPKTVVGRALGVNGSFVYNTTNSFVNENTLAYTKKIGAKHLVDAIVGLTFQGADKYTFGAAAGKLPNEELGLSGLDEGTPTKVSSPKTYNRLNSYLGRVNYSYDSRYLFTLSMRADGSSKFSNENRWSYFPSGSFAWRLSQENFMRDIKLINDAKIRTSYGLVGNNRVSDFAYQNTINSLLTQAYPFNGTVTSSVVPYRLGNRNLKWETTTQTDIGLDLTILKNKVNITIDVYKKVTKDLLLNADLPPSSGFSTAYKNIGKVENKGLEFSISSTLINQSTFKYTASFNISFNRNKILSLNGGQEALLTNINWDNQWNGAPAYIAKVGQPMGLMYGYIWQGNYQYSDFDKSPSGLYSLKPNVSSNTSVASSKIQPGHIKYKDLNGDLIMNDNDKTIIGNANPKFTGGFTNNFSYAGFDLNIFFQFSYGAQILNANKLVFEGNSGRVMQNQYATVLNRWTPQNQNNTMYVARGAGDKVYSSRVIEDGSYLRLKTVQIGYNFSSGLVKKALLNSARLYVSAQNLVTWTKYSGFDPEVSAYNAALTPGFDYSVYPRAKTVTVGLNLVF